MTIVALNNLWQYLQNLSLTDSNKRWLAQRLMDAQSDNVEFNEKTKSAIKEIDNGQAVVCNTWDEFLEAIK